MRAAFALGLLAALPACASVDAGPEPIRDRVVGEGGRCDADAASGMVGARASSETGAQIQARTGATIFQWVPPDSAVTMDYRPDRVRVSYDRDMRITRIACG